MVFEMYLKTSFKQFFPLFTLAGLFLASEKAFTIFFRSVVAKSVFFLAETKIQRPDEKQAKREHKANKTSENKSDDGR